MDTDKPQSLEAAKVSFIAILEFRCSHRFEIRQAFFASSRLRVRPFALNHRRTAARIARRRKRTLFPSDEVTLPAI
jgi:hypothetical protein